ncbi:MAG: sigma 54-interacting transcriptional regulator, partial [Burkholderiaceae bacterium]|nr:sigma 54-interacting transcriptional regulator [Burkholderiaceae bacterium]
MTMTQTAPADAYAIRRLAMQSLFESFDGICEGAVVVDREARIVWLSEKYAGRLGIADPQQALGRPVEEVIPNSLLRDVVTSGKPILLDLMSFGAETFVVTRLPVRDESGRVIAAVGFVLYDRPQYLRPLVVKFERLQHDLHKAQQRLAEERRAKYSFSNFLGSSAAVMEAKRQARRAAQMDGNVLLLGETGSGKELLAHAIHVASSRHEGPFIAVNVAAVPETLMEAEFFGVAPGAYTGADRKGRDGKFKLADGGTLFLDEIGDMAPAVQAKLLRVLQDQEFEPLGSNRVIRTDVRVIAATSRDLAKLVAEGRFRTDLYYRLNVLTIHVPPLRERIDDLELLCEHLLDQIARRNGVAPREIAPSALAALRAYGWPGNIRELSNVLERAVMMSENDRLTVEDFRAILGASLPAPGPAQVPTFESAIQEAER